MGAIKDLIEQIEANASLKKQEDAILDILAENEKLLTDLNRAQLMEGTDSENSQLKEYRSETYARMKASLNPKGVTDLRLSGDFHRSFVAITEKFPVLFAASNSKTDKLVNKYGENIFGLDEESQNILAKTIQPDIVDHYRDIFQL